MSAFIRVDSRLVHGQIIATWMPHLRLQRFLIASDSVPDNPLQQTMFRMAIPGDVAFEALPVDQAAQALAERRHGDEKTMVLLETVADAGRLFRGCPFGQLNLGNLHHGPGSERITDAVYLSPDDKALLSQLSRRGVRVDVRSLPSEPSLDLSARLR